MTLMNRSVLNSATFAAAIAGALGLFIAARARAQFVIAPDVLNDHVVLFSSVDGRVIDPDFITNAATGATMGNVNELIAVNQELWASEPVADKIYRFTRDGTHLNGTIVGSFSNPIDGPGGMAFLNGTVYVTCRSVAKHGG